jgi:hypothetical protein
VVVGVVVGFFTLYYAPDYLVLESSPKHTWRLDWLGWFISSVTAISYVVLDYLERRRRRR